MRPSFLNSNVYRPEIFVKWIARHRDSVCLPSGDASASFDANVNNKPVPRRFLVESFIHLAERTNLDLSWWHELWLMRRRVLYWVRFNAALRYRTCRQRIYRLFCRIKKWDASCVFSMLSFSLLAPITLALVFLFLSFVIVTGLKWLVGKFTRE